MPTGSQQVYTVHVTRPDRAGTVEIVFADENEACAYARDRSQDPRILSASVTRYLVSELGTRHPMAWYVAGSKQSPRVTGPMRQLYPTEGVDEAGG